MKERGYERRRTGKGEKEREGKMRRSNMGKEKVDDALSFFCMLELLKELKKKNRYIFLYTINSCQFFGCSGVFLESWGVMKGPRHHISSPLRGLGGI